MYAEQLPTTASDVFNNVSIANSTLHVPENILVVYQSITPWKDFGKIVAIDGEPQEPQIPKKCEKPSISFESGQLFFASATEDVEFISNITDTDIKSYNTATISLTATYNISVYAKKIGYKNSEVATATLCWVDADPKKEGDINGIAEVAARAVLVKTSNGFLTVEGLDDQTQVWVYTVDGKQAGSATSHAGVANVATNINPGSIAIVKIGEKAMKVVVK